MKSLEPKRADLGRHLATLYRVYNGTVHSGTYADFADCLKQVKYGEDIYQRDIYQHGSEDRIISQGHPNG